MNKLIAAKTKKIHPHFFTDSKAWSTPALHTKVSKVLTHIQLIDRIQIYSKLQVKVMIYAHDLRTQPYF